MVTGSENPPDNWIQLLDARLGSIQVQLDYIKSALEKAELEIRSLRESRSEDHGADHSKKEGKSDGQWRTEVIIGWIAIVVSIGTAVYVQISK